MTDTHTPHPWIGERKKRGAYSAKQENPGMNGRLALFFTDKFGSMWFFYLLVIWMLGWTLFATLGIGVFQNDPYPFTFLLFLSNLIQLLALPLLAVGQRILSRASEKQSQQTYKDAEAILELQDEVHRLIKINNQLTEEIHRTIVKKSQK